MTDLVHPGYGTALASGEIPVTAPRRKRVCIVTLELQGVRGSGGIGTAYHHLARLLAARHDVHILYCGKVVPGVEEELDAACRPHGLTFSVLREDDFKGGYGRSFAPLRRPYLVYQFLKGRDFDIVHFSEYRALGFYAIHAKKSLGAFRDTAFLLKVSSGTIHAHEANSNAGLALPSAIHAYMEKFVCENADALIAPSRFIIDWMRRRRYDLARPLKIVEKNYMVPPAASGDGPAGGRRHPVRGLAFIGRVEKRKGIEIFCQAVARLGAQGFFRRTGWQVAVVGDVVDENECYLSFLSEAAAVFNFPFEHIEGLGAQAANEAIDARSLLRVVPSLSENSPMTVYEALARGRSFIAARCGGIPELVDPDHHADALFAPDPVALAERIAAVAREGAPIPAPSYDMTDVGERTLRFHDVVDSAALASRTLPAPGEPPELSLVITHYNRADLLDQAIAALRAQSDTHFELVIVDDGSTDEAALGYLAALEAERDSGVWPVEHFLSRLSIVRQANGYLGAARNAGARAASHDNIVFADDDNVPHPRMIETYKQAARQDYDIVVSSLVKFAGHAPPAPDNILTTHLVHGAMPAVCFDQNLVGDAQCMIRKPVLEALGGYSELRHVPSEDHELYIRAIVAGRRIGVVPDPLYHYRVTDGQMSGSRDTMYLGKVRVINAYSEVTGSFDEIVTARRLLEATTKRPSSNKLARLPKLPAMALKAAWRHGSRILVVADPGLKGEDMRVRGWRDDALVGEFALAATGAEARLAAAAGHGPGGKIFEAIGAPHTIDHVDLVHPEPCAMVPVAKAPEAGAVADGALDFFSAEQDYLRGWVVVWNGESFDAAAGRPVLFFEGDDLVAAVPVEHARRDIERNTGIALAGFRLHGLQGRLRKGLPFVRAFLCGFPQPLRVARSVAPVFRERAPLAPGPERAETKLHRASRIPALERVASIPRLWSRKQEIGR